jgi:hypothetical protein
MKTYLSIFLILILGTAFSQSFQLLDEDEFDSYGAYSKQEGRKVTIYDYNNTTHFNVRSRSLTSHEYLVVKNGLDSTTIQSDNSYFNTTEDSTYFVIKNSSDTLFEVVVLVHDINELFNINYETSSNELINVHTITEWDEEFLIEDTVSILEDFFSGKYINLKIELTLLLDSLIIPCEFEGQEIFVNGMSVHSFDQYETTLIPELNLQIGDTVYIDFTEHPRECTEFWGVRSDIMIVREQITSVTSNQVENHNAFRKENGRITFDSDYEEVVLIDLKGTILLEAYDVNYINTKNLQGIFMLKYSKNGESYATRINL